MSISSPSTNTPSSAAAAAVAAWPPPITEMGSYLQWRPILDACPRKTIIRLLVQPEPTTARHSAEGWARAQAELRLRMGLLRDRFPFPGAQRFGGAIFWDDQVRFYTELLESDYYDTTQTASDEQVNSAEAANAAADPRGREMVDCVHGQGGPTLEAVAQVEGWLGTVGDNDPSGGVSGLLVEWVVV